MRKRVIFNNKGLPYLLLLPQLVITMVFFFWPAGQAIYQSTCCRTRSASAAASSGFENFTIVFADPLYLNAVGNTVVFSRRGHALISMAAALCLAVFADRAIRGARAYKTLLIWPYAVAPAVAAVLWLFVFHPSRRDHRPGAAQWPASTGTTSSTATRRCCSSSSPPPGSR